MYGKSLSLLLAIICFLSIFYMGQSAFLCTGVAGSSAISSEAGNEHIALDFRDADIRDVLSALALKMGVDIILVGPVQIKVTFQANNLTPWQALELIINEQGMTYLDTGQLLVVGAPELLKENFAEQMILTEFTLQYVPASEIKELLETMDLDLLSITITSSQNLIWIQGNTQVLQKVRDLIYLIDKATTQLPLEHKTITLHEITPYQLVDLLEKIGVVTERYILLDKRLLIFDHDLLVRWADIEKLAKSLDVPSAARQTVFTYQFKHITADYAIERLKLFTFEEDVKFINFTYEKFTREIVVICPAYQELAVRSAVYGLDKERQKTKVPLLLHTGANAYQSLNARIILLSELSGIATGSFHISENLSGSEESYEYLLWLEETPDNIQLVKDLLEEMN